MNFKTLEKLRKWAFSRVFCVPNEISSVVVRSSVTEFYFPYNFLIVLLYPI